MDWNMDFAMDFFGFYKVGFCDDSVKQLYCFVFALICICKPFYHTRVARIWFNEFWLKFICFF